MSEARVRFLTIAGEPCPKGEAPQRFTFRCVRKPEQLCANLLIANAGHGIKRDGKNENDGRAQWDWDGDHKRPTFSPSINCEGATGCGWHGYVRKGRCVDQSDRDEPESERPNLRLVDLEAQFLRLGRGDGGEEDGDYRHVVETFDDAQGVQFLCPKCFKANSGAVGTHLVVCWSRSRGVPDDRPPNPGRWTLAGTGVADLTLNGDPIGNARSVQITDGCKAHFHVTNGEIEGLT